MLLFFSAGGSDLGARREAASRETATRQATAQGSLLPQTSSDAHASREGARAADARQLAPRRRDVATSRAREATAAQDPEDRDEDATTAL